MARRRPPTADDRLRALRREAAIVASELARSLQHAPREIEVFAPLVVAAFRGRTGEVFAEINENQGLYEGHHESWFCQMRQVRDHSKWGPRLLEVLCSDECEVPAPPHGAQ